MADVQAQFEQFHETIRVDYDMASDLRESRDAIIKRVRKHLDDNRLPGFTVLHQGSYKMRTGSRPIAELEYDIDVGLRFNVREVDYDATTVRSWVYDAVKNHTDRVDNKGPCVRVLYKKGHHVDLVTYAVWDEQGSEVYRLAHRDDGWRPADPKGLVAHVDEYRKANFANTEDAATTTDQFRRCVRCLRRWNDVRMPWEADAKPTGLALVLLCIQRGLLPASFLDGRSDDRRALENLTQGLAATPGRLEARKPTPEYEELFSQLSDGEMKTLKNDLGEVRDALQEAGAAADPVEACKRLQDVFGDDFPIPEPEGTGKKTKAPAIITSSSSA